MKIAMIGHKRVPSRIGGVEVVVTELSRNMAAMNHSVTIYNRWYEGEKLTQWNGCRIVEIPTLPADRKTSALWYSLKAALAVNREKYDVLHFHAEGQCAMIPLAKLFRRPCVATIHGLDWQRAKWGGFATRYIRFGERMAAKYADRVIVLSKGVQDYFREQYGRETILIPNGITRIPYREPELIKEKFGLEKDGFLLFLARITSEKGLHYLLDAYSKIDTDIPLVVAGSISPSSEYIETIKSMAEKDPRVKLIGFVEGRMLEELYSNCRLYILPSELEGMPMSLLEAISFRAPCLVSDIPENVDVAPDCCSTFRSCDTEDLQKQLENLLEKPAERVSEEQTAEILKKHDWYEISKRTIKEYEAAIAHQK